jgi:hypothetical protein
MYKFVLVGHGYGGSIISEVVEAIPERMRRPSTSGKARSEPAAICQATPIVFAAARKYRRGRSVRPRRKQSRSATASNAATDDLQERLTSQL